LRITTTIFFIVFYWKQHLATEAESLGRINVLEKENDAIKESLENVKGKNELLLACIEVQNERIAQNFLLKKSLKFKGQHILVVWRKFAAKKRMCRRAIDQSLRSHKMKVLRVSFGMWVQFCIRSKHEEEKKIQNTRLETITNEIVTRYEHELEKV